MPVRFLNPNYHVILIHYPLGVFVLGVILEFFSFFWRRSSVRSAARWMILLGALLAIPAATSGIAALDEVKTQGAWSVERYEFMRAHVKYMTIGTLLAVFFAVLGLGASDRWRNRLRIPILIGLVASWFFMTWGAWYGGETIYEQGTSVGLVKFKGKTEPKPFIPPAMINKQVEADAAANDMTPEQKAREKYQLYARFYLGGERQAHIVFSGVALAIAIGALGLSIRRMTSLREHDKSQFEVDQQEASLIGGPPRRVTDDVMVMRTLNPDAAVESQVRVPVSRYWLLAAILTAITAALGYWILEKDQFLTAQGFAAFRRVIVYDKDHLRHFVHFYMTLALIGMMVGMMSLAVWAPRRPFLLTVASALLVFLLAAQVWIGILLTFNDEGPLTHFNPPDSDSSAMISPATSGPAPHQVYRPT